MANSLCPRAARKNARWNSRAAGSSVAANTALYASCAAPCRPSATPGNGIRSTATTAAWLSARHRILCTGGTRNHQARGTRTSSPGMLFISEP